MKVYVGIILFLTVLKNCSSLQKLPWESDEEKFRVTLSHDDIDKVKKFFKFLLKFLKLSRDVALHKWGSGIEIHQPEEDRKLLDLFEEQAIKLNVPLEEAMQIMSDLINAGRVVESVLTFDWYAGCYFKDEMHPYLIEVNITKVREKQVKLPEQILAAYLPVMHIQNMDLCAQNIATVMFYSKDMKKPLLRVSMQRALGNFCKVVLSHKK